MNDTKDYPTGGFPNPEQNWTKTPNKMFDILRASNSLSEVKTLFYILRHTWGFQEFSKPILLTIEEFESGRKRIDGTKYDNGTGLSKPSIIEGLKKAEEHGHIYVIRRTNDRARMRKFYGIVISEPTKNPPELPITNPSSVGKDSLPEPPTLGVKDFNYTPRLDVKSFDPVLEEKKEILIKENPLERSKDLSVPHNGGQSVKGIFFGDNDKKFEDVCAKKLYDTLSRKRKISAQPNYNSWKRSFKDLVEKDKVLPSIIKNVLDWYCNNFQEPFVPEALCGSSFRKKFDRIVAAMERSERCNDDTAPSGHVYPNIRNERDKRETERLDKIAEEEAEKRISKYGKEWENRYQRSLLDIYEEWNEEQQKWITYAEDGDTSYDQEDKVWLVWNSKKQEWVPEG